MANLKRQHDSFFRIAVLTSVFCFLFCLIPVMGLTQDICSLRCPCLVFASEEGIRGYLDAMVIDVAKNFLKNPQNPPKETPLMDQYVVDSLRNDRALMPEEGKLRVKVLETYIYKLEKFQRSYHQVLLVDFPVQTKGWLFLGAGQCE